MGKKTDRDVAELIVDAIYLIPALLDDINEHIFYPYILEDAEEQVVAVGGTCTFSITAANVTSYQWQRRTPETPLGQWDDISGATSSSYSFTVSSSDYDNVYRVKMVGKIPDAIWYNQNVLMVIEP